MFDSIGKMTRHKGAPPPIPPGHQRGKSADGEWWLVWPLGMRAREAWGAEPVGEEGREPVQGNLWEGGAR